MRDTIVNARKLYRIVVEVSTCHFRAVPVQARPKMRAGPCSPSCWDPYHGMTLVCVSCQHGPKYFVSCRASGRAKRSCHDPPSNGTAQVPALVVAHIPRECNLKDNCITAFVLSSNRVFAPIFLTLHVCPCFSKPKLPCAPASEHREVKIHHGLEKMFGKKKKEKKDYSTPYPKYT